MYTVLNSDVAAQICKVSHQLKFFFINLNLLAFFEFHANDFSLFLIDLKPCFPSIFCEKLGLLLQMICCCG